jgi:two-component sensor histidine kinase
MPQAGARVFERLPVFTVEPRSARAFALAAICAAAAFVVRYVIGTVDPLVPPFPTFFVAIMLVAILGGAAAGIVCAILGLSLAWLMFEAQIHTAFSWGGLVQYALASALIIWIADQYRRLLRRVQDREKATERQMRLIEAENETMALIAADKPLAVTLGSLVKTIEQCSEDEVLASILLLDADGEHLAHCAAPSLPDNYNRAIDGWKIGPEVGSCGTAAFFAKSVFVSDIETDPLWTDFRDLARQHGLRACWSTPIMSRMNTVLGTFALYYRQPRSPKQHDIEIVTLLVKIAALAIERERGREQRLLLIEELSHRMKNSLAVVSSIASSTLRPHVEKSRYVDFEQRLLALAQVQSLLTQTNWAGIGMLDLIKNVATIPFKSADDRFRLNGPPVHLPAQLTLPFALSIHELCTNAVKYGSLSIDTGRVEINWGYQPEGTPEQFYLRWIERDGPPVSEPTRKGFGSRMIKTAFAQSAGGDAVWTYGRDGLECEIHLPAAALANSTEVDSSSSPQLAG